MSDSTAMQNLERSAENDHVLFLSDVLTRFGNDAASSHTFNSDSPSSSSPAVVISPRDIISSMQYRNEIEEYRDLAMELEWAKTHTGATVTETQQALQRKARDIWLSKQNRLGDGRFSTDEDTSMLVEKMEVWSAKEIVNEVLLQKPNPGGVGNGSVASHSSLLSMPSGDYMAEILPPCRFSDASHKPRGLVRRRAPSSDNANSEGNVGVDEYACRGNLAVTANSLTWREMLRLASMVSALPESAHEKAFTSRFTRSLLPDGSTIDNPRGRPSKKKSQPPDFYLYSARTTIHPPDLVALWIRAQRHTSALRHLNHLFIIRKEESGSGQGNSPTNGNDETSYIAFYSGNYKRIKDQIELESPLVNELIDWAITNQVLFTFHRLCQSFSPNANANEDQIGNLKRYHSQQQFEDVDEPSQKKRRQSGPISNQDDSTEAAMRQTRAHQAFVLRLFAWRNLDTLSALCTSNPDSNVEDNDSVVKKVSAEMVSMNIPGKVKDILKKLNDSTDRTLFRIDRRILIGKFESETNSGTFVGAVRNLLAAFKSSLPTGSSYIPKVEKAEKDFEKLLLYHISDETESLKNLSSGATFWKTDSEDIAKELLTCPRPWLDRCIICEKDLKGHEEKKICWNCGSSIHKDCEQASGEKYPIPTLHESPLLPVLYSISSQELPPKPDYVAECIEWSHHTFQLNRVQNQSWGMLPSNPFKSSEALDQIEKTIWGSFVGPLLKIDNLPSKIPLRIPHDKGIIVAMVGDGPAKIAGLKEGDIIVEIHVQKDSNDGNESFFEKHDLTDSKMSSWNDKKMLLKDETSILQIKVLRPSKPILEISRKYVTAVSSWLNNVAQQHHSIMKDRWYCADCYCDASSSGNDGESVEDKARLCQAVIRRLSLEWHSIPFHDEQVNSDIESTSMSQHSEVLTRFQHGQHVSLRRLDSMMDWIISGRYTSKSEQMIDDFDPFLAPPWSKDAGNRLDWADKHSEARPYEILCRGIGLLINPYYRKSLPTDERIEFRKRFIELFLSWCCGGNTLNREKFSLPTFTRQGFSLFVGKTCTVCASRPLTEGKGGLQHVCDSRQCRQMFEKSRGPTENVTFATHGRKGRVDELIHSNTLYKYEYYSSFIGTLLLVLPGDPLLSTLEKALKFSLDLTSRPCEIVILSYVPRDYISDEVRKNKLIVREKGHSKIPVEQRENDGFYYAVPILSQNQLKYLLNIRTMRDINMNLMDKKWFNLKMLEINGVIELTPDEFTARLKTSISIQRAIDEAVFTKCVEMGTEKVSNHGEQERVQSFHMPTSRNLLCANLKDVDEPHLLQSGARISKSPHSYFCSFEVTSSLVSMMLKHNATTSRHLFPDKVDTKLVDYDSDSDSAIDAEDEVCHKKMNLSGHSKQQQLNVTDKNPTNGIEFIHGIVYFQEPDVAKKGICSVSYTDMLYWNKSMVGQREVPLNRKICKLMEKLEKTVSKQNLKRPLPIRNKEDITSHNIILHRMSGLGNSDEDFPGKGWGVELVRWSGEERFLRVGRIVPNSPASRSGLMTHDIIKLVSGQSTDVTGFDGSLAGFLLGSISEISTSRNFSSAAILYKMEEPVTGPVVLCILRPKITERPVSPTLSKRQPERSSIEMKKSDPKKSTERNLFVNMGKANLQQIQEARPASNQQVARQQPTVPQHPNVTENRNPTQQQEVERNQQNTLSTQGQPQLVRRQLAMKDLYVPGLPASFLSLAETSVLIETLQRLQPCLAVRLLAPRYNSELLRAEYQNTVEPYVKQHGNSSVPRLSQDLYEFILNMDYKRSLTETGPIIFKEQGFAYRMPESKLPIDRICEQYFHKQRQSQTTNSGRNNSSQLPFLDDQSTSTNNMRRETSSSAQAGHTSTQTYGSNGNNSAQNYGIYGTSSSSREALNYSNHGSADSANGQHQTLPLRGGGYTIDQPVGDSAHGAPLSSLSRNEWNGRVVYGKAMILTSGMKKSLSYFVGTVNAQKDTIETNRLPKSVAVAVFVINESRTKEVVKQIPLDDLFLMPNTSSTIGRKSIMDTWKTYKALMRQKEQNTVNRDKVDLYQESFKLMEQLKLLNTSTCNLGYLPDGRTLHWLSLDPTALYVRTSASSVSTMHSLQREFCYDIERNNNLMNSKKIPTSLAIDENHSFYCPWGCTCTTSSKHLSQKPVLGFDKENDLLKHLVDHHGYRKPSSDFNYEWQRLSEGMSIIEMGIDISSAICARYYFLSKYSSGLNGANNGHEGAFHKFPFEKRRLLDPEKIVSIVKNKQKFNLKKIGLLRKTRELIVMFSKIARLFKLENTGDFRLHELYMPELDNDSQDSDDSVEKLIFSNLKKSIGSLDAEDTEEWNGADEYGKIPSPLCSWLQNDAAPVGLFQPDIDCALCRVTNERNVRPTEDSDLNAKHSVGSALLSDTCFFQHKEQKSIPFQSFRVHGQLDAVKHLILKVASNIPQSIRITTLPDTDKQPAQYSIWQEGKLELWTDFVMQCVNCRMIIQAYILILSSIQKQMMPGWWKSNICGWSSPFVIIQNPTLSNLSLHIYTLDAAIVEYMSAVSKPVGFVDINVESGKNQGEEEMNKDSQTVSDLMVGITEPTTAEQNTDALMERHFKENTFPERMRLATKRAVELGIPRKGENHDDNCYLCSGEGDLLCCEFCTNVCHEECTGYDGSFDDIDWVCNECERDILFVSEV